MNDTTKAYLRKILAAPMGFMQLLTLVQGLRIETRTGGQMQITRGPKATTLARRWLGIKGNREKLLHQAEHILKVARRARSIQDLKSLREQAAAFEAQAQDGDVWVDGSDVKIKLYGLVSIVATGLISEGNRRFSWPSVSRPGRSNGTLEDLLREHGFDVG